MDWPPYFALDLTRTGLLPHDWMDQVHAATRAPERLIVQSGAEVMPGDERFSILPGPAVRARFGWLWDLYLSQLRDFVSTSFGQPAFAANRVSSAITLNILEGVGAENGWHTDSNQTTGVFYATTLDESEGGALEFRHPEHGTARLAPRAGTFVCFRSPVSHRVAPLTVAGPRLAFAMIYYDSVEDQPFANLDDRYEMSPP